MILRVAKKSCIIQFLLFFSVLSVCTFGTDNTAAQPQCAKPSSILPHHRSYIRDGPLHEKLVDDTWKALNKFVDSSGNKYRPRYFEGWYYKIDLPGKGGTFVVIPGLYLRKEEQHAFVMILDATQGADSPICHYYKFPIEKVFSEVDGDHDFVFRLDDHNVFTAHSFALNLPEDENHPSVVGSAEWEAPLPLPSTLWNPTIIGWFSWLPRGTMQCSHGVVSMDHSIVNGMVTIGNSKAVLLTGAQGYIEKDWGREFPERYTWIQANDFSTTSNDDESAIPGASFLVSGGVSP